jgi:hypothetical protein
LHDEIRFIQKIHNAFAWQIFSTYRKQYQTQVPGGGRGEREGVDEESYVYVQPL